MATKFFTGLPTDGPDPECVQGYGEAALAGERRVPVPSQNHPRRAPTRNQPVLVQLGRREDLAASPVSAMPLPWINGGPNHRRSTTHPCPHQR